MIKVAVLDDWQEVAHGSADWSALQARAEITFLSEAFASEDNAAVALADFDIVLSMRERTPFPRSLIERLRRLRMLGITGARNLSLDLTACTGRGVVVCSPAAGSGASTAELALGLLLSVARAIPAGDAAIRTGRFQAGVPVGITLAGKTLGIVGVGRLGSLMAQYGRALGMAVLGWSQNITREAAAAAGAELVTKDELLARSDAISLHLVLSPRSRNTIGAAEIARMKPGAILINTSRGPLVDENALIEALHAGRLFAGLDVYDREPLPADHRLRRAPNTVLMPPSRLRRRGDLAYLLPSKRRECARVPRRRARSGREPGGADQRHRIVAQERNRVGLLNRCSMVLHAARLPTLLGSACVRPHTRPPE